MVLNYAYRYIGNMDDAEDILQDVFMKLWTHIHKIRDLKKIKSWLSRTTYNRCMDFHREKKQAHIMKNDNLYPDFEQHDIRSDIIKNIILQLPERQRAALIMQKYENKSYKEIAESMDISLKSVEALIYRAKKSIKENIHGR